MAPSRLPIARRLPLCYFDDRIVLSPTAAWTYLRVPTVAYDFLADGERDALADRVALAIAGLRDAQAHLVVVPRAYPVEDWAHALDANVTYPAPGWQPYLAAMQAHLAGMHLATKEVYLGVKLGLRSSNRRPLASVERLLGLEDHVISDREIAGWHTKADTMSRLLGASGLHPRPATTEEVRWLIQRSFWRGIAEPPSYGSNNRPWGPGSIEVLFEGGVDNGVRALRLDQAVGEAWVAVLGLAHFPDTLAFPGGEWLYHADSLDFPVEISLRFKIVPPHTAATHVRRKLAEVRDQERHIAETGAAPPLALVEQASAAELLEYELTKQRVPLAYSCPRLIVTGADPDELSGRVQLLTDHYRDLGIALAWPAGDQLDLLLEALPGSDARVSAYEQKQSVLTLAGGMPHATSDLGDGIGPYLGQTSGRRRTPVHFDPLTAAAHNRPTVVSISGEPGGGKTFLALLQTYSLALRGAWILDIDPKGEHAGLVDLPGLPPAQILELGGQHTGLLDPFALADTPQEGAGLAVQTLCGLLPPKLPFEPETQLVRACRAVAERPNPCLYQVIDELQLRHGPTGGELAAILEAVADYPLANLCFAPAGGRRLSPDGALTVVQFGGGLQLPQPGVAPEHHTWPERLSAAVMFLVADYARRLATRRDRHQPKAIVLDEAHVLSNTDAGRALLTSLARMGRSRNTAVLLISQNAADFLDEAVLNCVSAKFAFRSTDPTEIAHVLKLLGIADTDTNRATIRSLRNGECLFADLDGRVGTLAVDPLSEHLRRAFDTTPQPLLERVA